ncbi:hypothetical protein GCWU000324_01269 [Kingella oralis ATCC 51147]|uniref:Uncharacterized protein n=1 Tax=Kingella oralis ATCC 51147 TaxID=629741 RepID=C4GGK1_9NEIS|nr:hypothetical protein GCWU000324_01269 [Kingella oralis ATCC 51147]
MKPAADGASKVRRDGCPVFRFQAAAKRTQKKRCEPTAFTPKHTHQEENNLEISQNNNLRCLYDAAHYGG